MTRSVLRVGLVTEGPSDWMVLGAMLNALCVGYELDLQRLHPPRIPIKGIGSGWPAVRSWCVRNGPELERLMRITPESPLHLLAIHVDGSIANKHINPLPACPPAGPTADALRHVISSDWLKRAPLPPFVILVVPMQTTDTWVIAAHLTGKDSICECDVKTDHRLARLGSGFRWKDGQLKKPEQSYQPLAHATGQAIQAVRTHCVEAERFCQDVDLAARAMIGA